MQALQKKNIDANTPGAWQCRRCQSWNDEPTQCSVCTCPCPQSIKEKIINDQKMEQQQHVQQPSNPSSTPVIEFTPPTVDQSLSQHQVSLSIPVATPPRSKTWISTQLQRDTNTSKEFENDGNNSNSIEKLRTPDRSNSNSCCSIPIIISRNSKLSDHEFNLCN